MQAVSRDILITMMPEDKKAFQKLPGAGSGWGVEIKYPQQSKPEGLAQASIIGDGSGTHESK